MTLVKQPTPTGQIELATFAQVYQKVVKDNVK